MSGTETVELNAVDQLVKNRLLESPGVFGSRLSVLSYVFFVGGDGYSWKPDGTLGSRYPETPITEMYFADLDRPSVPTSALDAKIDKFLAGFEPFKQARKKRLRAIRTLMAEDIDLYAKHNIMDDTLHVDSLRIHFGLFELDDGLIATAPFEILNHDWARAMMELLNAARETLRESLCMRDTSFSRETADQKLLGYYDKVEGLLGKVAKVPGLINKAALESVRELLQQSRDRHLRGAQP